MNPFVRIEMHDENNPMMVILVDNQEYQFSVANVKPSSREWLGDILSDHLQLAFTRGKRIGMTEVQDQLKTALGIK